MRQLIPTRNVWFLPALVIRILLYLAVRLLYSVSVTGKARVPARGAVLLVANHVSYVDVLLLQASYPRHICFVAHEYLFRIWWLGWFLRMMGVVSIQPRNARQAFQRVVDQLRRGRVVCVFPEGQLAQTGFLQRLKPGFQVIATQAGCPVQPAYIDGIWGSVFSFAGYRFWGKRPLRYRHAVRVGFGEIEKCSGSGAIECGGNVFCKALGTPLTRELQARETLENRDFARSSLVRGLFFYPLRSLITPVRPESNV